MNKRFVARKNLGFGDIVASFDSEEEVIEYCSDKEEVLYVDTQAKPWEY